MSHVLTLIANPLTDDHVHLANSQLPGNSHIDWLAEGSACDLFFDAGHCNMTDRVRDALDDAPVDIYCQSNKGSRRKKLLLADMDSTIITTECIDEMADFLGLRDRVAVITERAMAGDLDFHTALLQRAAILRGLSKDDLQFVYNQKIHLTSGARKLVATMTTNGAYTVLVSGGFTFFSKRVAEAAGFDHHRANVLQFIDNHLTGKVTQPILGSADKLSTLHKFAAQYNVEVTDTIAVGDGANDLEMVSAAGLGVAFHATPILAQAAAARIDYVDLTALLYLQGYKASQIRE